MLSHHLTSLVATPGLAAARVRPQSLQSSQNVSSSRGWSSCESKARSKSSGEGLHSCSCCHCSVTLLVHPLRPLEVSDGDDQVPVEGALAICDTAYEHDVARVHAKTVLVCLVGGGKRAEPRARPAPCRKRRRGSRGCRLPRLQRNVAPAQARSTCPLRATTVGHTTRRAQSQRTRRWNRPRATVIRLWSETWPYLTAVQLEFQLPL